MSKKAAHTPPPRLIRKCLTEHVKVEKIASRRYEKLLMEVVR